MVAEPKLTPFNFGVTDGIADPAWNRTVAALKVTFDVSLLVKVTYTLFDAGDPSDTG